MLNRRGLLLGLGSALAAPAIVHAGNLMPVKRIPGWVWMGDVYQSSYTDTVWVALQSGYDDAALYWESIKNPPAFKVEPLPPEYTLNPPYSGVPWRLVATKKDIIDKGIIGWSDP